MFLLLKSQVFWGCIPCVFNRHFGAQQCLRRQGEVVEVLTALNEPACCVCVCVCECEWVYVRARTRRSVKKWSYNAYILSSFIKILVREVRHNSTRTATPPHYHTAPAKNEAFNISRDGLFHYVLTAFRVLCYKASCHNCFHLTIFKSVAPSFLFSAGTAIIAGRQPRAVFGMSPHFFSCNSADHVHCTL